MLDRRILMFGLTGILAAPTIIRASSLGRLSRKSNSLIRPSITEIPFPDEIKWEVDAIEGLAITAMRFYGSRTWIPIHRIPLEFTDSPDFSLAMFGQLDEA